jgi:hypothetical protein
LSGKVLKPRISVSGDRLLQNGARFRLGREAMLRRSPFQADKDVVIQLRTLKLAIHHALLSLLAMMALANGTSRLRPTRPPSGMTPLHTGTG